MRIRIARISLCRCLLILVLPLTSLTGETLFDAPSLSVAMEKVTLDREVQGVQDGLGLTIEARRTQKRGADAIVLDLCFTNRTGRPVVLENPLNFIVLVISKEGSPIRLPLTPAPRRSNEKDPLCLRQFKLLKVASSRSGEVTVERAEAKMWTVEANDESRFTLLINRVSERSDSVSNGLASFTAPTTGDYRIMILVSVVPVDTAKEARMYKADGINVRMVN
jgi:hypothetical protein